MSNVVRLSEGFYVLKDAQASVSFTGGKFQDTVNGGTELRKGNLKIAPWGKNNLLPQEMFRLIWENHLKPQLITTARDFLIGSRLGVFRRQIVENKETFVPIAMPEIEDWLEEIEAENYIMQAAYNLEFWSNVFTVFTLGTSTNIEAIQCFDCTDVRASVISPTVGRIEDYVLHPDWKNFKEPEATVIPSWDRTQPTRFFQFCYHGRDPVPGQPYYSLPTWYGTRKWTEVSNEIPKFHKSGLANGYNLKYHIEIPADYFLQFGDDKAQQKAEADLLDNMNQWLSGVENVAKAFVSKFQTDAMGKPIPGWKIEPLEDKMNTEAYIELDRQANTAHASGHGIDPSLAGIDQNSKLGGSGSEKRISYDMHIALRTPTKRKILLQPFNTVAKKIMGWDRDIFIGIVDIQLTTLADNPSGKSMVNNLSDPSAR